jgi:ribonuclease-3
MKIKPNHSSTGESLPTANKPEAAPIPAQDAVDYLAAMAEFSSRHGLNFHQLDLLARAMTHRSYINEHPEAMLDNERLEFLGDAVLDFLVAAWLYQSSPEFDEGRMTRYRAALVGNEQLAQFARRLDLGPLLRVGRGEEDTGGRSRTPLLGSAFEALIGALYIDQGLETVRQFVTPMLDSVVDLILEEGREVDAKSLLQEWAQANGLGTPSYRKVEESGPDHAKTFVMEVVIGEKVYGRSEGRSKQAAAKAAAQAALSELGIV